MQLATMAWRTLMRNKRRSVITAFSVAFGVLLSVTFTASSDYAYTNMINTSAVMGLGHLSVEHPEYQDIPTLDKRLPDAAGVQQRALQTPGITAAQIRIMGQEDPFQNIISYTEDGQEHTVILFSLPLPGDDPHLESQANRVFQAIMLLLRPMLSLKQISLRLERLLR